MYSDLNLPVKKFSITPPQWLRACASLFTALMLIRSMTNQFLDLVPEHIHRLVLSIVLNFFKQTLPISLQRFALSFFHRFLKRLLHDQFMTLQIEQFKGMSRNEIFDACQLYLQDKTSPNTRVLQVAQSKRDVSSVYEFVDKQEFEDMYQGIQLQWKFHVEPYLDKYANRYFELTFDVIHKEKVKDSYLPYVLERFQAIKSETKVIKLHTLQEDKSKNKIGWDAITFEHYATFETLAMEPEMKQMIIEDLDRFVEGKEFFKRVGRVWKRGYLLYGPPGTGKSSLIAAMANHLKFDIYDLQLSHLESDKQLRQVLIATNNKSILVIEDIDCSFDLKNRNNSAKKTSEKKFSDSKAPVLSLSGILNFVDGLWSSCGEERIIVFTTNHKSKLDPALLRPGRMDMYICMSYCTYEGFKILARNYLEINEDHTAFDEIESLLRTAEITPAEVAGELRRSKDAEVALQGLINMLKQKQKELKEEKKEEHKDKYCYLADQATSNMNEEYE